MSTSITLIFSTLRWLIPFMILPLSWVAFRYLPRRRLRLTIYFFLFVTALIFDLFHVSFASDAIDLVIVGGITFMAAEYLWLVSLLHKKRLTRVAVLLFFLLQLAAARHWIAGGPQHHHRLWQSKQVAQVRHHNQAFVITERSRPGFAETLRSFSMKRLLAHGLFERTLDTWTVPEGYSRADYTGRWIESPWGIQHQVLLDNTPLWTLKSADYQPDRP
jgi:hypothetical protein